MERRRVLETTIAIDRNIFYYYTIILIILFNVWHFFYFSSKNTNQNANATNLYKSEVAAIFEKTNGYTPSGASNRRVPEVRAQLTAALQG